MPAMSLTTLYCGDPHGRFDHINRAANHVRAATVVLLGDMEAQRPLELELGPLLEGNIEVFWIPGNHDSDSDAAYSTLWNSKLADRNIHGRVVMMRNGQRIAGLGGVFREVVWYPDPAAARSGSPAFRTRVEHAKATPRKDRWQGGHHRRHWGTIYPDEVDRLAELQADVLVTHEAPGYHQPAGFDVLDTLAQALGVKVTVHGHHHDNIDSSARWIEQGFKSFGVGLRGITAIDEAGNAEVIVPGELDAQREARARP